MKKSRMRGTDKHYVHKLSHIYSTININQLRIIGDGDPKQGIKTENDTHLIHINNIAIKKSGYSL